MDPIVTNTMPAPGESTIYILYGYADYCTGVEAFDVFSDMDI